jgi:hypothetical protein
VAVGLWLPSPVAVIGFYLSGRGAWRLHLKSSPRPFGTQDESASCGVRRRSEFLLAGCHRKAKLAPVVFLVNGAHARKDREVAKKPAAKPCPATKRDGSSFRVTFS